MPKVYNNLFEILVAAAADQPGQTHRDTLNSYAESMEKRDTIGNLIYSDQFRSQLRGMASVLGVTDTFEALEKDDQDIAHLLREIGKSESGRIGVLQLRNKDAEVFVDLIEKMLDHRQGGKKDKILHQLLLDLSEASNLLPSSLILRGVIFHESHPTYVVHSADIFFGVYKERRVAVKLLRISRNTAWYRQRLCQAMLFWRGLEHQHVVPLLGVDADSFPQQICMVFPWMGNGTVLKFMRDHGPSHIEQHIRDVAEGLAYLHSKDIVHGEVRGDNILIDDDMRACLTAFSRSEFDVGEHVGLPEARWSAPECEQTLANDVWAFGCSCVELYTGKRPFSEFSNDFFVMAHVAKGGRPVRPVKVSDGLWSIMNRCWAPPDDRVRMDEVVGKLKEL